jgi:hypothetical protein
MPVASVSMTAPSLSTVSTFRGAQSVMPEEDLIVFRGSLCDRPNHCFSLFISWASVVYYKPKKSKRHYMQATYFIVDADF